MRWDDERERDILGLFSNFCKKGVTTISLITALIGENRKKSKVTVSKSYSPFRCWKL